MTTALAPPPTAEMLDTPYPITADLFQLMVEREIFPPESRVFLWDGRLYEKMAKTQAHAGVHSAFLGAISRRLPPGCFLAAENPVKLDSLHLPLPDLIVARGQPLALHHNRFPDGRDVVLVIEVAVTSLKADLGPRLSRYALALPGAIYLVADVPRRRVLIHSEPRRNETTGRGEYGQCAEVGPGGSLVLKIDGVEIGPIPFEEVMG